MDWGDSAAPGTMNTGKTATRSLNPLLRGRGETDFRKIVSIGLRVDVSEIPVIQGLVDRMRWLNRRQKILSENVANANTPGYRSQDLPRVSFVETLRVTENKLLEVKRTDAAHIDTGSGSTKRVEQSFRTQKDAVHSASPSGNAVNVPEQMMKMTETQMDFGLASTLYRKHMDLIKLAIGRGR